MSRPDVHPALAHLEGLRRFLGDLGRVAVAVSGGVDSVTLAVIAHRRLGARLAEMFHAVSPAVPDAATERVRHYAWREGWALQIIDAGEFSDDAYRANPANRCFHCKNHLYGAIARRTDATRVSGTNRDDLGDFRPGLDAARKHGVKHPYVEVGIDKRGVRALARRLGLDDLAELPAAPCLSSRVETGIAIRSDALRVVDRVEEALRVDLSPETVRCRMRAGRIVVELDDASLRRLSAEARARLRARVSEAWRTAGFDLPVHLESYRMGSAFLRTPGDPGTGPAGER